MIYETSRGVRKSPTCNYYTRRDPEKCFHIGNCNCAYKYNWFIFDAYMMGNYSYLNVYEYLYYMSIFGNGAKPIFSTNLNQSVSVIIYIFSYKI